MVNTGELEVLREALEQRLREILNCLDIDSRINKFDIADLSDEADFISADLQYRLSGLIAQKYGNEVKKITKALKKINNKTYGICEMCDEEIKLERLKIKPHAEFCIKCREIYEKDKKIEVL